MYTISNHLDVYFQYLAILSATPQRKSLLQQTYSTEYALEINFFQQIFESYLASTGARHGFRHWVQRPGRANPNLECPALIPQLSYILPVFQGPAQVSPLQPF